MGGKGRKKGGGQQSQAAAQVSQSHCIRCLSRLRPARFGDADSSRNARHMPTATRPRAWLPPAAGSSQLQLVGVNTPQQSLRMVRADVEVAADVGREEIGVQAPGQVRAVCSGRSGRNLRRSNSLTSTRRCAPRCCERRSTFARWCSGSRTARLGRFQRTIGWACASSLARSGTMLCAHTFAPASAQARGASTPGLAT